MKVKLQEYYIYPIIFDLYISTKLYVICPSQFIITHLALFQSKGNKCNEKWGQQLSQEIKLFLLKLEGINLRDRIIYNTQGINKQRHTE
jgi:hypothetical protein